MRGGRKVAGNVISQRGCLEEDVYCKIDIALSVKWCYDYKKRRKVLYEKICYVCIAEAIAMKSELL